MYLAMPAKLTPESLRQQCRQQCSQHSGFQLQQDMTASSSCADAWAGPQAAQSLQQTWDIIGADSMSGAADDEPAVTRQQNEQVWLMYCSA